MRVSTLATGNRNYSQPCELQWMLLLPLLGDFFPGSWVVSHALIGTQLKAYRISPADLQSHLPVQLSGTLPGEHQATWPPSNSQLHLFHSDCCAQSGFLLPTIRTGSEPGQLQDSLHLLPISQGSLSLLAWHPMPWTPLYHTIAQFICFRWKGMSDACIYQRPCKILHMGYPINA